MADRLVVWLTGAAHILRPSIAFCRMRKGNGPRLRPAMQTFGGLNRILSSRVGTINTSQFGAGMPGSFSIT